MVGASRLLENRGTAEELPKDRRLAIILCLECNLLAAGSNAQWEKKKKQVQAYEKDGSWGEPRQWNRPLQRAFATYRDGISVVILRDNRCCTRPAPLFFCDGYWWTIAAHNHNLFFVLLLLLLSKSYRITGSCTRQGARDYDFTSLLVSYPDPIYVTVFMSVLKWLKCTGWWQLKSAALQTFSSETVIYDRISNSITLTFIPNVVQ